MEVTSLNRQLLTVILNIHWHLTTATTSRLERVHLCLPCNYCLIYCTALANLYFTWKDEVFLFLYASKSSQIIIISHSQCTLTKSFSIFINNKSELLARPGRGGGWRLGLMCELVVYGEINWFQGTKKNVLLLFLFSIHLVVVWHASLNVLQRRWMSEWVNVL